MGSFMCCVCVWWGRETEIEGDRDRQRDVHTERHRDRDRDTETHKEIAEMLQILDYRLCKMCSMIIVTVVAIAAVHVDLHTACYAWVFIFYLDYYYFLYTSLLTTSILHVC